MHLWSKRTADRAWQWAKGPQYAFPRPTFRTFCGRDFLGNGAPAQTIEQYQEGARGALCPQCAARMAGHLVIIGQMENAVKGFNEQKAAMCG